MDVLHLATQFLRLLLFLVLLSLISAFRDSSLPACLLLSLPLPPLCCTCWRLVSNIMIGTTAGKIFFVQSLRLVFSQRSQGEREKRHQSVSVNSNSTPCFLSVVAALLPRESCPRKHTHRLIPSTQDGGKRRLTNDLHIPPYSTCNFPYSMWRKSKNYFLDLFSIFSVYRIHV